MKLPLVLAAWVGLCVLLPRVDAQETKTLTPSLPAVKSALTDVISRQLDAFRSGDFAKAYAFASSGIRKLFPPDIFENMVKTNYPMVVQAGSVDFGASLDNGEEGLVFVRLTGTDGKHRLFRYTLTFESGAWKITGVEQTQEEPPITA